jgi:hypothetical protein
MTKKPAKPGRKAIDRARKKISRTIAMRPAEWAELDAMRGKAARGVIIARKLNLNAGGK